MGLYFLALRYSILAEQYRLCSQFFSFHMLSELDKYCTSDVTVLRKAVFSFREQFMNIFDMDIFEKANTLAAGVMKGYQRRYLTADTIQNIPETGEGTARRMQSVKALKCLAWVSKMTGKNIRTAASSQGERKIACGTSKFWADGVVEDAATQEIKEIIEFFGCVFILIIVLILLLNTL